MKRKLLSLLALFTLVLTLTFSSTVFAETEPDIIGTSAIIMDVSTKEIIYSKNMNELKQPASITKLMTALLLAENKTKTDLLTYSEGALAQDPYSYGLNVHPVKPGDKFTGEDTMEILLLYSGNDIAYMVAENVGGNVETFVNMMNEKAAALGMTNTHFVTPNGLDDNTDDHYTTAYDLTLLLNAIYENQWVKETIAKKTAEVSSVGGMTATVENRNKLVGVNGNVGGKTGYTDKSGRCLASLYERDGRTLAVVVLNSEYDMPEDTKVFADTEILANYGFSASRETYMAANTEISEITAEYKIIPLIGPKKTVKIPVAIHDNVELYNSGIEPEFNYTTNDIKIWSLNSEKPIGSATVTVSGFSKTYDIYPTISRNDILKSNIIYYVIAVLILVIIIALIFIIISKIKKRKRRKKRRLYR